MSYILILDDDEDFAAAVAKVLRDEKHEVEVLNETPGAVARMEQRPPDLVVLDVMFPEDATAGFKIARALRQSATGLARVPVLMLTAVNQKLPVGFAARDIDPDWLPVTEFLEKPVDLDLLVERARALLKA